VNLLYLEAHSILAHDELKMFADLGYNLFAIGSYVNPHAPHDPKRPALPQIPRKPELEACLRGNDREHLPDELIEWADAILFAGLPDQWLIPQWDRIKHKNVVWRTIGQSNYLLELKMREYHDKGVQIVRYSPAEERFFRQVPQQDGTTADYFAGQDALIRFGKYPEDWGGMDGRARGSR
jgi:hypothetical protein